MMNHSYTDKRKCNSYSRLKFKNFGIKIWAFTMLMLFGLQSISVKSQQYPVKLVPVVIPPYSMRLGDYATSTDNKLQLQVLMTDLLEPQHQTGIKFTLEAGLNAVPFAKSNDFIVGMNPFLLYPGSNITLTNVDLKALFELQNLGGINALQYSQPLSDGVYQYCFQAYDYYTKNNLSAKTCATVFLTQYDPPMLNIPQNAEKIQAVSPYAGGSGIVFQWMPRQIAPNTKYIFTLKELWDTGQSPVSGFLSSPPLWQEETYAPTLYYGLDKTQLIPGKRYAWQVQAKSGNPVLGANSTEDNGVYKNNGFSEIYYFDYVENCTVPTLLMAKNVGRGRVEISWSLGGQPAGLYNVQYRKKNSNTEWMTQQSYQSPAILTGLEDVTEYEYRVGSVCGQSNSTGSGNAYSYSVIQYFTTNANDVDNNYQCGIMPAVDIANKNPLQSMLGVNEVFTAGDFPVTVLSAEGSNGIYTGTGYIIVPYLADTRVKVVFSNIMLNTDKKLIEGIIETTYDPNESAVSYVSAGLGETFGDAGVKEVFINYPIGNITYSATPPPGKITITGSDGGGTGSGSTIEYPGGKDYTFTDSRGDIWTVDENGTVTKGGTVAQGGASTSTNTDGVTGSGKNASINQYTAKGVKIEWKENTNGQFAYDTAEKTKLPKDKYPSVKDSENNTVYVPYKATVNKKTELFDAKVSITDPTLKDAKIIFKTLSIGKAIEASEISKTDTERNYQLKLIGSFEYAEEEVIAVLMPKDSTSKQKIISSFRLVHLSPKTINVALVPTDSESKNKLSNIETQTNAIYKKVGVEINFNKDELFDIAPYLNGSSVIPTEKNTALSTYSSVQQAINKGYGNKNSDRYVLFVSDRNSDKQGLFGYMRLNGQFGYVFKDGLNLNKTGAHELGHGIFKLEHPFENLNVPEATSSLLMDYSTGEELSHLDWKQINDPAFKLYAFQGQSSGEDRNSDGIDLLGNIIEKVVFNETDKTLIGTLSNNQNEKYLRVGYELYSNADKKLLASYPAKIINNKVVYEGMPYNVITRSSGRAKINLLADKCYYSTTYINWEKPVNVTASEIITLIVENTKNSVWENNSLFNPDPSCSVYNSWADIKANDQSCTADKINTEIPILKSLLEKNIDADTATKTVNQYCLGTLRNLTYETILKYIKLIAGQKSLFKANVPDDSEIAILRLISAISSSDYPKFFNELESTNNELINNLITELDDHSVFFWDGNNYTNFIGTLLHIYTVYPDAWINKVGIEQAPDYFVDRYLTKPKVQIKDIGELIQGGSEIYWQSFVYDDNSGNIVLEQNKGNIQAIGGSGNTVLYSMIGAPSIIKTTTVSPLSPVIIDYNNDVDAVKILLENSGYKEGDVVIIPAIFLKYGLDKIEDRAKEKSTLLALNTVTIATGMPVILQGAILAKRVWAAAEVAGALGDIAVNNQYIENKYPELKQTINAYNGVMGLIAVKNLVTSKGAKNLYSAAHSTVKTAFQNRNEFKSIIAAKYLDWNGFTMKFKSPEAYINTEVRKTLEEQESVLGLLSGKVLRKFNNADEIAQYLKTDKDGAYFWSGRMSNNQGVMDIALDIAQSKGGNTLEGMLAKYNIEMPIWDANNPASVKAWEDVSALYATQVSGEVNAVLGKSLRPGNIWETVELPRLKTNTNVTKISTIDPETMKVTILFSDGFTPVTFRGNTYYKPDLSRINFANGTTDFTPLNNSGTPVDAGWSHVVDGHFNRPLANSRSIFNKSEREIQDLIIQKSVIQTKVIEVQPGIYKRTADLGKIIGNEALKFGGKETSWVEIFTDVQGNIITTYPVPKP